MFGFVRKVLVLAFFNSATAVAGRTVPVAEDSNSFCGKRKSFEQNNIAKLKKLSKNQKYDQTGITEVITLLEGIVETKRQLEITPLTMESRVQELQKNLDKLEQEKIYRISDTRTWELQEAPKAIESVESKVPEMKKSLRGLVTDPLEKYFYDDNWRHSRQTVSGEIISHSHSNRTSLNESEIYRQPVDLVEVSQQPTQEYQRQASISGSAHEVSHPNEIRPPGSALRTTGIKPEGNAAKTVSFAETTKGIK